jgi:methylated-DNA-[protein]-cysteine S-methyltransferase
MRDAAARTAARPRGGGLLPAAALTVGGGKDDGAMTELAWATLGTPVGRLSVGCSQAGLSQIRFGGPPARVQTLRATGAAPGAAGELASAAVAQIAEYFSGQRRHFDLLIDWSGTSPPQQQVLRVLFESVGYGETVSYGTLARRAGLGSFGTSPPARAVGRIMGSNPIPLVVPCHRVVAADGLGGYSGGTGPEVKRWLLTLEGALPPTLDWDAASFRA